MRLGLIISTIIIILDQLSKWWVFEYLLNPPRIAHIFPGLLFRRAWNKGISFSMLSGDSDIMPWILSAMALVICAFLLNWMRKVKEDKLQVIALGFIIGGAIGNVIDRIRFGAVADFIDVYIGKHHWPAFNIADSAIFIGACLLIIHSFITEKKQKANEQQTGKKE